MVRQEIKDLCSILSENIELNTDTTKSYDWKKVIHEASWHRVMPLLVNKLNISKNTINSFDLPEDVFCALQGYKSECDTLTKIQFFELKIISEILQKHEIDFIVLKGLPLSYLIYNATTMRTSKDIDILISKDDLEKVVRLLENLDYTVQLPSTITDIEKQIFHKYYNQIQAHHKTRNICIEIHWTCTTNPHLFNTSFNQMYENSAPSKLLDLEIRTLKISDTIIYLCCHFSRTQILRLKWLCDIDALINNHQLDWLEIDCLAKRYSCNLSLKLMLITCNKLLGTPIPEFVVACPPLRSSIYQKLTLFIINSKSKFLILSLLRLLAGAENMKIFYHDLTSILSPRIHDSNPRISNYTIYYLIIFRRLLKLQLKLVRLIVNALRQGVFHKNEI